MIRGDFAIMGDEMTGGQQLPTHAVRPKRMFPGVAVMLIAAICLAPKFAMAETLPREAARLINEGAALLAADKPDEALKVFDHAADLAPRSAEIAFNRGIALYRLGEFDKAQIAFQNAIRSQRPDLAAKAKYNRARSLQENAIRDRLEPERALKQLQESIKLYDESLALNKDDADARQNRDSADRMAQYFTWLLEQMKKQPPPSEQNQGGDEKNSEQSSNQQQKGSQSPSTQQSDDGKQPPSEQNQEGNEQNSEQNSDQQQEGSPSTSSDNSDSGNPPKDGEESQPDVKQNGESTPESSESPKSNDGQEDEKTDREQSELSAGEEGAASETTSQPATQPTTMPSQNARDASQSDSSQEHALRLLQEIRDAERERRKMQREAQLRRQGRMKVDKDW
ncbi:MAG: tetratricopeptide repeat protein [Phycisphaerae bacterium]|nr:tetratricopeptide repeat protein [Phycisphaerae bacterium]